MKNLKLRMDYRKLDERVWAIHVVIVLPVVKRLFESVSWSRGYELCFFYRRSRCPDPILLIPEGCLWPYVVPGRYRAECYEG